jgi:hypothetical protein
MYDSWLARGSPYLDKIMMKKMRGNFSHRGTVSMIPAQEVKELGKSGVR